MQFSAGFILFVAHCVLAFPQLTLGSRGKWKVGQRVKTSSGPVDGHLAPGSSQVSEYLGIPFAKPPVGALRFEPPQPYTGSALINGSHFGHSCPQLLPTAASFHAQYESAPPGILTPAWLAFNLGNVEAPISLSEDCLTVNIWTKPQVGEKSKAVLVWIYGGGWINGVTQIKYNYGQHLAAETDVVVVSFNYRLNILGFPGSPGGPLNSAVLDQRLAIEWIHQNIAQFGGDPSRITLVGQSAGGNSIDTLLYAYPQIPLFAGAIVQSGTVYSYSTISQTAITANWAEVASEVSCTGTVSQIYQCMKTVPWQTLLATPLTQVYSFWPTVDETLIFANYTTRSLEGKVAKVPLLIGMNDNEAGLFKIGSLLQSPAGDPAPGGLTQKYLDDFNFAGITCPSGQRANASVRNDIPTWRYRWFGAFPNLQLTSNPDSGAWHGEEISIIWNTEPVVEGVPETAQEKAVGKYVRGAWAAFAKDPVKGLRKLGWKSYDPEEKTLVRLAYGREVKASFVLPEVYDEGCGAIGKTEDLG